MYLKIIIKYLRACAPPPSLDLRRRFVADLLVQLVKFDVVLDKVQSEEGHEVLHVPVIDVEGVLVADLIIQPVYK